MRVVELDGRSHWVDPREMDCWKWFWTGVGLGLLVGWIAGTVVGLCMGMGN